MFPYIDIDIVSSLVWVTQSKHFFFLTGVIVTSIARFSSYLVISKRDKVTGIKELDMCPRLNLQDTSKYLQCSCKF